MSREMLLNTSRKMSVAFVASYLMAALAVPLGATPLNFCGHVKFPQHCTEPRGSGPS
jgi:hypothetical protein